MQLIAVVRRVDRHDELVSNGQRRAEGTVRRASEFTQAGRSITRVAGLRPSHSIPPIRYLDDETAGSYVVLLFAAGLYQFSAWKQTCLTQCRDPARFLASHARHGMLAAFRLGILHGGYCVGCCWLLMALLFVGGVMNLFWIVALSVLVLCEKLLPGGPKVSHVTGGVLVAWAIATLLVD